MPGAGYKTLDMMYVFISPNDIDFNNINQFFEQYRTADNTLIQRSILNSHAVLGIEKMQFAPIEKKCCGLTGHRSCLRAKTCD